MKNSIGKLQLQHKQLVYGALLVAIGLWGSSFPAIKLALVDYSPMQVATIRFVFASLALLLFCYKSKLRVPKFDEVLTFFALSLIGIFGYHLLLNYGENLTNAGTAGFVVNIAPLFSIILASIFFKEKLTFVKLLGASIALVGVLFIVKSNSADIKVNTGILFLILAALCWSLFFIIQKNLLKKYSSIEITCYGVWIATLLFLIFNNPLATLKIMMDKNYISSTVAAIYLGIFPTSIAYWLWAYGLQQVEVSTASIYTYAVPFISSILAYYFIGEHYNASFLLGGGCIIIGIAIANHFNYIRKGLFYDL